MQVRRFDRTVIPATKRTAEGYLRVDGSKIARVGIQIYRKSDGTEIRELRLPEEVFAQQTVDSFKLVPLTNGHPSRLLDATDAKAHAVGAVGEPRRADDTWMAADINVWDQSTIEAIENGRVQLSAGYTCNLVEESGEWNGERYDAKQVGIVANHLALVDAARAGPEARLRLDGNDAEAVEMGPRSELKRTSVHVTITPNAPDFGRSDVKPYGEVSSGAKPMAHVLKLDGFQFEVNDPNAQAVIDRMIAAERAKLDAANAKQTETQTKLDEATAKLTERATADGAMGECDECDGKGKIADAECEMCSGEGKLRKDSIAEKLSASVSRRVDRAAKKLATERASLLVTARELLGNGAKLDEMDNDAIKVAVVKQLKPSVNLDGKSADAIDMAYTVALADQPKKPTPIDLARTAQQPSVAPKADDASDPDAAYRKMQERNRAQNVKAKK